jgi:predicted acylesterase/phospholipase RssA
LIEAAAGAAALPPSVIVEIIGEWWEAAVGNPAGPSTAIALSGGGTKGSFEVGALAFLRKRLDEFKVDYVLGSSTGALNALALSSGGMTAGTTTLIGIYLGLRGSSSMYTYNWRIYNVDQILQAAFNKPLASLLSSGGGGSVGDATALLDDINYYYSRWYSLLATELVFALTNVIGVYILWEAVGDALTKISNLQLIMQLLQHADSIYTLDPVRQLIDTKINLGTVGRIPLRMATVDLETGTPHFMDENGDLLIGAASASAPSYLGTWTLNGARSTNLTNGAIASASIPGAFPPQLLRVNDLTSGHFVDGGTREMIPLKAAKDLGVQRIIAIFASPPHLSQKTVGASPAMASIVGRSLDILTNEVAVNEQEPPDSFCDTIQRIFIYPEILVHDTIEVDPGLIRINLAYGYMRAYDMYLGQTGQLNVDIGSLLLSLFATQALIELRREAHAIEQRMFHGWNPANLWFDKPDVDTLRDVKRQILEMAESRFLLLGEDTDCLPIQLAGTGGANYGIREWWETWEHHSVAYENALATFDLWAPLPIGLDSAGNQIMEDAASVPARPATSLF